MIRTFMLKGRRGTVATRAGLAGVAGALVVALTVDPFGLGAVGPAFADQLTTRADGFKAAMAALTAPSPIPVQPISGSWGALSAPGAISVLPAQQPAGDQQVVVLTQTPPAAPAALGMPWYAASTPLSGPAPVSVDLGGLAVTVAPTTPDSTPQSVVLKVADPAATDQAGITGVLLDVSDASTTPVANPQVEVTVSYSTFAGLGSGDWASRLQFVWIPDCTNPGVSCAPQPISTVNDPTTQTVTATVPVDPAGTAPASLAPASLSSGARVFAAASAPAGGGSLAITAGASGAVGDWGATSLAPSSSWGNSGSTGAFTWSLPLQAPAVAAGPAPQLAFSYTSSASDGRTPSTNNQSGTVGEGFGVTEGYVERTYTSCSDDEAGAANNIDRPSGDLCWGVDNATMMFNGTTVELVRDAASGLWRSKHDDGTLVERITGSSFNSGEANEYWKVTTADGVQYFFGRGKTSATGAALNSAWTVPVYGNQPGERCYQADFAASQCTQVWRWNLDYVVDPSGNSMTYFYDTETNRYVNDVSANYDVQTLPYVSGGHVNRIEYGTRAGQEAVSSAPAKVTFGYAPRCIKKLTDATSFCSNSESDTGANHWLDTPVDLICTNPANNTCKNYTPVFFDRTRLATISTATFDGASYRPVDSWALNQIFAGSGENVPLANASNVTLVLKSVTHTGQNGTTETSDDVTPPPFQFSYGFLQNRIDTGTLVMPLVRPRVIGIRTDAGAQVTVNYTTDCSPTDVPSTSEAAQAANTRLCFPVKWSHNDGTDPVVEYFHKYVVASIVESGAATTTPGSSELITGSLATVTTFDYSGGAAWAKPTGALVKPAEVTYSDFRGFATVTTTIGTGDESSRARVTYYRGMGTTLTGGPTGNKISVNDREQFQGQVFLSTTLNGSIPTSDVITVPGDPVVVANDGAGNTATRIPSSTTYGFSYDAAGALVHRTSQSKTFDQNAQLSTINDLGDLTTATDDTCTRVTYAHEASPALAAKHLLVLVAETSVVATSCSGTPTIPTDLISDVQSTYDGSGRLVRTDRLDPTDGVGFILGNQVLAYDVRGRPLQVSDALGRVTTTAYQESAGGLTQAVTTTTPDPDGSGPLNGFTSTTNLNPLTGRVTSTVDANGLVTSRTYDALGRLLTVVLPQRQGLDGPPSVQYAYAVDPAGNGVNTVTTKTLRADGESQQVSVVYYDGLLRPFQTQTSSLIAPRGDAASQAPGRMIAQTYYNSAGRVSKETGQWYSDGEPSAAPVIPVAVPPSLTTHEYDAAGRPVADIFWVGTDSDPANERWRTVTVYDGATTLVIPPKGGTPEATVVDARGRVTQRIQYVRDLDTDASADTAAEVRALPHQSTSYAYDAAGQLTALTDSQNTVWSYRYDWGGRQVSSTDPDSGTTSKTYDALNRVVTQTDANGATLAYTFDVLGRADTVRDGSVTGTIRSQFVYDRAVGPGGRPALGLLSQSTRIVGGKAYTNTVDRYDAAYRPVQSTFTLPASTEFAALASRNFTNTYSYTADGQVKSLGLPEITTAAGTKALGAETVTTQFDSASMPSWMSGGFGWGTYVADSRYGPDGRLLGTDLGNTYGNYVTYGYEQGTNRLASISLKPQSGTVNSLNLLYGYDAAGNVTSVKDQPTTNPATQDNQCFSFDGLRRLQTAWTSAAGTCAAPVSGSDVGGVKPYWSDYTYDAAGNRTSVVQHAVAGSPAASSTYVMGAGAASPHQVSSVTDTVAGSSPVTTAFTYDAAGNRVSKTSSVESSSYRWDAEGELVSDDDYSYIYDASGTRIVRTGTTGTTVYLPGGQEVTVSGSTVSAVRYYSFAGVTVAMRTGNGLGAVSSLVCDRDGTPVASVPNTNSSAAAVSRVYSDPFGSIRGGSDAGVPGDHRFLGATRDQASGLTLLGARYYDPVLGRFLSVDPVLDVSIPAHLNAYSYGFNNPVTFSDASGLEPKDKNGHYDGAYYGTAGGSSGGGGGSSGAPPDTSWAGFAACADALCRANWNLQASLQFLGGIGETLGSLLWETCPVCQLGQAIGTDIIPMFTGWDAYWAGKQADAMEKAEFWKGPNPWGQLWDGFWKPIGDDWANNPGHAAGGAAATIGTIFIPSGGAIKAGSAARAGAKVVEEASAAEKLVGAIGAACSFAATTPVLLADGTHKNIADLKVGDEVLASDPVTGEQGPRQVTHLWVHTDELVQLDTTDGSTVTVTVNHPFWNATDQAWEPAEELDHGDQLLTATGDHLTVVGLNRVDAVDDSAYNLTIEGLHTYYVGIGTTDVLVHNTCGPLGDAAIQVTGRRFPKVADADAVLYKQDGGSVTSYQVYGSDGLPLRRVDLVGASHNGIPTPHVQMFGRGVNPETGVTFVTKPSTDVRAAYPWEVPNG